MNLRAVDSLVANRYHIRRLIGRGGQGAVYEAVDTNLGRQVALKQLLPISESTNLPLERLSAQFEKEAQILANLDHPALPRVTHRFTDGTDEFLVMDFVPGDDLGTLLLKQGVPFPVERVVSWGVQLLGVLHYLHTQETPIIHRDIKPQNLKLRADGGMMLLDFGLAKGYAGAGLPATPQHSFMGYTYGYAAPEQIERKGTDARTDLYALGATLYYLLTKVPLMEAQIRTEAAQHHWPEPLRPPHIHNPQVPEALSQVLMRAMALAPQERPQSALEMRQQLQAVRLLPPGGPPKQRRWPLLSNGGRRLWQRLTTLRQHPPPAVAVPPQTIPPAPRPTPAPGAQPPQARLVGPRGTTYTVTAPRASVGRRRDGFIPDIDLSQEPAEEAQFVSQHHLDLIYIDGQWYVQRDLQARNPTFLGGYELLPGQRYPLANGMDLTLPTLRLRFYLGSG